MLKSIAPWLGSDSKQMTTDLNLTNHEFIPKAEFDALAKSKAFADGPHISTFGDAYGEPYNPNKDLWGTLTDGRKVKSTTGGKP